jgi:hypothetical protein
MAKRRRKRNQHNKQALTHAQLRALIPGGAVNAHRAKRDDIDLETRALSDAGNALVTGEIVNTPVRKLLMQKAITLGEAWAAQAFKFDFDAAYASCVNPLSAVFVDGGSGDGTGAANRRLEHAQRYRKARAHLRSEMYRVAEAAILELPDSGIEATYTGIGREMLPDASVQEQRAAGKACLVLVIRELAVVYGQRNPNRSHIVMDQ